MSSFREFIKNFLLGAGSVLNLSGNSLETNEFELTSEMSNDEALASDIIKVNDDFMAVSIDINSVSRKSGWPE